MSIFSKLSKGLSKTRTRLGGISQLMSAGRIDEEVFEEIEELLLLSDMGVDTAERMINDRRSSLN
mgnify:CR=1 FL=1